MIGTGWDYGTLLTNGWFVHWEPTATGNAPVHVTFTYYRSEITVHSVIGRGATRDEAIADAVAGANAWLQDHPGYQPRQPWITA